ncbi:G protein-coupled receptor 184 [Alosa alosa]|uniref:G protein-coupled receptor 184 n=1 Tax=Alosa alosa TaxID=278164 RepID=UPI0020153D4A|nr:G protein-coupled receptor 184 [Alosa alosa]
MTSSQENMGNSTGSCVDIEEKSRYSDVLMGIYILAFIFGLVTNLIVFAPIVQQIRRKNVLGIYLVHLSVSDLLFIVTIPLWIYYYYQDHHWSLPTWSCDLAGFVYYSNMYISIYLLCCISVDRCLTISFPFQAKTMRRSPCAWGACAVVFAIIASLHAAMLKLDKEDMYDNRTRQCYETYPINERIALFNLLRVGLGFTIPFVVLVVCYTRIWTKVRGSTGLDERGKQKVKRLAVAVISIFCVCFFPYHLLLTIRSIAYYAMDEETNCAFEDKLHFVFASTLALSSLNCVVDPVLYMLASNGVREDMRVCYRRRVVQSQPVYTATTKI